MTNTLPTCPSIITSLMYSEESYQHSKLVLRRKYSNQINVVDDIYGKSLVRVAEVCEGFDSNDRLRYLRLLRRRLRLLLRRLRRRRRRRRRLLLLLRPTLFSKWNITLVHFKKQSESH